MAARKLLGVRISDAGNDKINEIVAATGATRSAVGRVLLGEAIRTPAVVKAAVARLKSMQDPPA